MVELLLRGQIQPNLNLLFVIRNFAIGMNSSEHTLYYLRDDCDYDYDVISRKEYTWTQSYKMILVFA